jgi:hypothetical protein
MGRDELSLAFASWQIAAPRQDLPFEIQNRDAWSYPARLGVRANRCA